MIPNETTSTFQVTSEQFPLLFDYVSHVSYDTQEKMLSLTLPLFTKSESKANGLKTVGKASIKLFLKQNSNYAIYMSGG